MCQYGHVSMYGALITAMKFTSSVMANNYVKGANNFSLKLSIDISFKNYVFL